jgi:hypothetical protein
VPSLPTAGWRDAARPCSVAHAPQHSRIGPGIKSTHLQYNKKNLPLSQLHSHREAPPLYSILFQHLLLQNLFAHVSASPFRPLRLFHPPFRSPFRYLPLSICVPIALFLQCNCSWHNCVSSFPLFRARTFPCNSHPSPYSDTIRQKICRRLKMPERLQLRNSKKTHPHGSSLLLKPLQRRKLTR